MVKEIHKHSVEKETPGYKVACGTLLSNESAFMISLFHHWN